MRQTLWIAASALALATGAFSSQAPLSKAPAVETVRTILGKCLACHSGPSPSGRLSLMSREGALKGGATGSILMPGEPDKSLLIERVASGKMPPGKPLSRAEVGALRQWVAGGAVWPAGLKQPPPTRAGLDWWSLQPIRQPRVPILKAQGSATSNPIDCFVQAELSRRGLHLSPPADRRTLIRRVTYDLIGLPPTPDEVDAFVRSMDPKAYEKLVDRLLGDPRYGERWGRHWLDVVRFGESQGFERDHLRPNSWPYRDYVIRSFNTDKPYNQFIVEQLAGDALNPQSRDGIVATGFLAAGPWDEVGHTSVSPAVRKRARDEELEDIIGTVSQTFLGLTANCARCHDHKFDPIPTRDYYRLRAAFEGALPGERTMLTADEQRERASEVAAQQTRIQVANAGIGQLLNIGRDRLTGHSADIRLGKPVPAQVWTFERTPTASVQGLGGILSGDATVVNGRLKLTGNGSAFQANSIGRDVRERTLEVWVTLSNLEQRGGSALTIQTPDGFQFDAIVFGERVPRKWSAGSDAFRRTRDLEAPDETDVGKPIHIAITYGTDGTIAIYRNGALYGAPYKPEGVGTDLQTYPAARQQFLIGQRHRGSTGFLAGEVEEARIYTRALTPEEVLTSFKAGPDGLSLEEIKAALSESERKELSAREARLEQENSRLKDLETQPIVYAIKSTPPLPTHILVRGDPDNPGEVVTAGGLSCCGPLPGDIGTQASTPEGERRLALARWIADRRNPLTARVMVNRIWHYHFSRGIVGSPNDFGFNGDRPTHPELLDYLATRLIDGGWRLKPLHRLILLSSTYRQSGHFDPKAAKVDADNRWLWRFSPRRLEGEAVRDSILAVSGRLNPSIGGPSFRPFTVVVNNSSFYTLVDKEDPELDRRTVYRMNINGARMPLLETLDCPDPSTKTPRRTITTTALQALELMNSTFATRQSRWFAERVRKEAGSSSAKQVERAYVLALGRRPAADEAVDAASLVNRSSLQSLCWALFNMNEFLYVR